MATRNHSVPSIPPRPVTGLACLACVAATLLGGCATQDPSTLIGPWTQERFQETSVQLGHYRPVQDRLGGQDPSLAVALAVSGGGYRAGNLGIGAMLGLEETWRGGDANQNALNEVDYLSTVSGGGLAAATYVGSLHDYHYFGGGQSGYSLAGAIRGTTGAPGRQWTDPDLRHQLQYDYVGDIIHGAFSLFTFGLAHRGDFLENAFDDHILGRLWRKARLDPNVVRDTDWRSSLRLSDMFIWRDSNAPVRLPYWVANATVFENAAIFAFAPDQLEAYHIQGYRHRLEPIRFDPRKGSYRQFVADVPMALGLTASGTFPVLIPPNTLESNMDPRNPYLHLLDGGVSDNLGVVTAIRLLRQDRRAARKVLIVVDAYQGPLTPFSNVERSPAAMVTAARMASGIFMDSWRVRSRELVRNLCREDDPNDPNDRPIEPVFLSFDDLADCNSFAVLLPYGFGDRDDVERLRREGIAGPGVTSPFAAARNVMASYAVQPGEQKFLLAVGRYLVARKRPELLRALGWPAASTQPAGAP